MRSLTRHVIAALLLVAIGLPGAARAELVPIDEAQRVADNFVQMMVVQKDGWGADGQPQAGKVVHFMRDDRLLAYACPVDPVGYVVVAAYREMAPIRAFSMTGDLDVDADTGPADALKLLQEEVLDAAKTFLGHDVRADDDFRALMEKDFEEAWAMYLDPGFSAESFREPPDPPTTGIAYQEGETLLSTSWGQQPPYNDMCPTESCSWPDYEYYNTNVRVGCVATAGAQICRYYNWPPTGTGVPFYDVAYDWPNMPEQYEYHNGLGFKGRFDGVWDWATQANIDASAEISWHVGASVSMDYGCSESTAATSALANRLALNFRFDDNADKIDRPDYSYEDYINYMIVQFEKNQPVAYRIEGHAVVADGYDEIMGSYYIHIVYGHNGSSYDGWWGIGSIPGGGPTSVHYYVRGLVPNTAVWEHASGYYTVPLYPYRYFSQDIHAYDVDLEFAPGHNLQVLGPGLLVEMQDTGSGATVQFSGIPAMPTVFYQQGDPAGKTRIMIHDAEIKIHEGGQMVIH